MVDDLIQQNLLLTLNKKDVLDLLGFEFNDSNSNIWTYYIGKKGWLFSSKKYLSIFFDRDGFVYKTKYN